MGPSVSSQQYVGDDFAYIADLPRSAVMAVLALARITVKQYVVALQVSVEHAHFVKLLQTLADMLKDGIFAIVDLVGRQLLVVKGLPAVFVAQERTQVGRAAFGDDTALEWGIL